MGESRSLPSSQGCAAKIEPGVHGLGASRARYVTEMVHGADRERAPRWLRTEVTPPEPTSEPLCGPQAGQPALPRADGQPRSDSWLFAGLSPGPRL